MASCITKLNIKAAHWFDILDSTPRRETELRIS